MDTDRYFVTVTAPTRERLKEMAMSGLDLFMPTAHKKGSSMVIEGLLTLEEVAQLVKDGCRVSVDAPMESRARAVGETTSLDAWLQTMGE